MSEETNTGALSGSDATGADPAGTAAPPAAAAPKDAAGTAAPPKAADAAKRQAELAAEELAKAAARARLLATMTIEEALKVSACEGAADEVQAALRVLPGAKRRVDLLSERRARARAELADLQSEYAKEIAVVEHELRGAQDLHQAAEEKTRALKVRAARLGSPVAMDPFADKSYGEIVRAFESQGLNHHAARDKAQALYPGKWKARREEMAAEKKAAGSPA